MCACVRVCVLVSLVSVGEREREGEKTIETQGFEQVLVFGKIYFLTSFIFLIYAENK